MPVIGIGSKITDIRQGRGRNPAGFNYNSSQFCNDNSTIQTPTAITPGGTYSISPALTGFNNSNGTFTPNSASSITGSQQYTVTHTLGTGEVAQSVITIFESFTVTITGPTSICDGAASDITLVATGAPAGSTYLWTPGNLTTSSIDVRPTTQTVYDVTVTNGACSDVDGHVVSINPKPSATITGDSSFCNTGGSATLTAGNPGTATPYTYSWFLNGNSTGGNTNSITVSQEGNYTLQISDSNGCVSDLSPTFAVSRTPDDVATVTYPSTICKVPVGTGGASGSFALDGYFPLYLDYNDAAANSSDGGYHTHIINGSDYYMPNSGVVIYHGDYSLTTTPVITGQGGTFNNPTGLSINTQTGVIDKNASTAGTYDVEYTTNGSCPITVTNSITITALDNATFAYSSSAYCDNVSDPTPTKSATGTFSSSTGLSINTSTGEVDLDASTAGTYVIGFVTNGSCPNSSIQTLTINAAPTVAISGTLSYCAGSNTTLTATAGLSSYLWSSGETTQSITATAGSYTVTGTGANGCSATSPSVTVTETALDDASFSYSQSSYAPTDPDPTPTITGLTGGTFSAGSGLVFVDSGTNTGSSTGEIDLSASTSASYTITYDTTSSGSSVCPNTSTFSLTVAAAYSPFQMQFDTSGGKTITIPNTVGSSFTVNWGDGNTTTETGGTISHTYASGIATSTVSIGAQGDTGAFTSFAFANSGSKSDLIDIPQWGSITWSSMERMFYGCNNTSFNQLSATDNPISDNVSTMKGMFRSATYFNSDVSGFNVDSLTTTENMFYLTAFNNGDSGNNSLKPLSWDFTNNTTGLSNISNMFPASFNQDISSFKLGSINLQFAFLNITVFNNGGQSLNTWDTSGVTSFFRTFRNTAFNQNIYSWDVSSVTTFVEMFRATSAFNQNLSDWYVNGFSSSLSTMATMFYQTTMTSAQFTDTIVGWAVAVRRDSAPYNVNAATASPNTFDATRTQDTDNSGNSVDYSTKYGSDWDSNWNNAGDARQFLLDNGWTVS